MALRIHSVSINVDPDGCVSEGIANGNLEDESSNQPTCLMIAVRGY